MGHLGRLGHLRAGKSKGTFRLPARLSGEQPGEESNEEGGNANANTDTDGNFLVHGQGHVLVRVRSVATACGRSRQRGRRRARRAARLSRGRTGGCAVLIVVGRCERQQCGRGGSGRKGYRRSSRGNRRHGRGRERWRGDCIPKLAKRACTGLGWLPFGNSPGGLV